MHENFGVICVDNQHIPVDILYFEETVFANVHKCPRFRVYLLGALQALWQILDDTGSEIALSYHSLWVYCRPDASPVVSPRDRAIFHVYYLVIIIKVPDECTLSSDSAHGLLNIWTVG